MKYIHLYNSTKTKNETRAVMIWTKSQKAKNRFMICLSFSTFTYYNKHPYLYHTDITL